MSSLTIKPKAKEVKISPTTHMAIAFSSTTYRHKTNMAVRITVVMINGKLRILLPPMFKQCGENPRPVVD
jgi:hypothetical protein